MTHSELFDTRAPGNTCLSALSGGDAIGQPAINDSKGCGGVMRVAPIGMLYAALGEREPDRYERAFDLACDAAALTHGHPTGFLTAGVMAVLVLALLEGEQLESAVALAMPMLRAREKHEETLAAVELAQGLAQDVTVPVDKAITELGGGWVAEEALAIGLYCALRADAFEEGIVMAVNHDGDSDSTGLIAGHLLGILQGVEAIPERWLAALELRGVLEEVADDLATVADWPLSEYADGSDRAVQDLYFSRYPA
jgi:ADP-ribosylglycohydrolase